MQSREFAAERDGYEAVKPEEFVGVGYFDEITDCARWPQLDVSLEGSTEKVQFVS